jgi:hypothetical protein
VLRAHLIFVYCETYQVDKSWFQQQLDAIYAAPALYLAAVFAVGASVWWIASEYYSGQISTIKERIVLIEGQRDDYKSKLSGASPDEAKARLDKLEASLAAMSPRKLTADQTTALQTALTVSGLVVVLHDVACVDCKSYANAISSPFKTAGWQVVTEPLVGPIVTPRSGIGVSVENPSSPSSQEAAILRGFKTANIQFDIIPKKPPPPPPPPAPGAQAVAPLPVPDVYIVILSPQ